MVGDVERLVRSIPSSVSASPRDSSSSRGSGAGVKSRDRLLCSVTGALEDVGVFTGEDLVGEIDLARSESSGQLDIRQQLAESSQQRRGAAGRNWNDLPARRAWRSFLPCSISSSSFLFLSSSSWSLLSPSSLMRWRKSLTSSEASAGVEEDMLAGRLVYQILKRTYRHRQDKTRHKYIRQRGTVGIRGVCGRDSESRPSFRLLTRKVKWLKRSCDQPWLRVLTLCLRLSRDSF